MEFRYDYEYLLHLISCYIHGTTPQEKPEGISFENVFELGRLHEVANIAFLSVEKLKNKPADETYNDWKIFYYFSAQRDELQRAERRLILDALHEKGIRTLEVQGSVMKKYYPSSELRMMSDLDFIIDPERLDETGEILKGLGYSIRIPHEGELNAFNPNGTETEIHTEFFTPHMFNEIEMRYYNAVNRPFEHAVPSEENPLEYIIDDTYFYLFSIVHILKHFETAGCGIRRILDIFYLKKHFSDKIDKDLVKRIIDENGMRKNYNTVLEVEGMWFEKTAPTMDLSEAVRDIITSGNHGNSELFRRNRIRKSRSEGVKFAKLKVLKNYIFPDREYIYMSYPELRSRNYTLAQCRRYRFRMTLKSFRFSNIIKFLKSLLRIK